MTSHRTRNFCVAAGLVVIALTASIPASSMQVCWVKKTPDGFVALRAQPGAEARLISRMKGGDVVQGVEGIKQRGGWWYVTWWKESTHNRNQGVNYDQVDGKVWVKANLIEDDRG